MTVAKRRLAPYFAPARLAGVFLNRSTTPNDIADPFDLTPHGILYAAHDAVLTIDDGQRIVMINAAAQRMFGVVAAEALGSPLSRFIPERLRHRHAASVQRFDESGLLERPMGERDKVRGLRANGEEFALEARISRLEVADGRGPVRYFVALMHELSAPSALGLELDALKQRMRAIFELAPVAIWITEGERIVFANRACAELFGTPDHEGLLGQSVYALLRPESHASVKQKLALALSTDNPVRLVRERIARLDGDTREVEIALAALPDHGRSAVQMVITDVTQRRHEGRELERSRRELRRLSASLVEAREEERRRIARELHDELGQRLSALKMELASLVPAAQRRAQDGRVIRMLDMIDETVASVRRIAADLRPLMLDDLGLNAAVEWLARESERRMGIEITLRLPEQDPEISARASIALFRMVQEALTNIGRHARATEVEIEIQLLDDALLLTVQDNGVGFAEHSIYREGSHGLMGMRERAYMLGGQFQIGKSPSGGASIAIRLPLQMVAVDAVTDDWPASYSAPGVLASLNEPAVSLPKTGAKA